MEEVMPNRQRHVISLQNVDHELWEKVQAFLQQHKRIPSISALGKAAVETYLEMAVRYGIDHDWKIKLPDGDGRGGHEAR